MSISRRAFLKLAALSAAVPFVAQLPASPYKLSLGADSPPNIILVLFDALSAKNLSIYGYERRTTPNLERLASRSLVFHRHYSAGNFTTPSTASLFTSVYPWTHRAFSLSGLISPGILPNNLFGLLHNTHHQAVFTQNLYADMLLYQFESHLDRHQALDSFAVSGRTLYNHLYPEDAIAGLQSHDLFLFKREAAHGSLLLSLLNDLEMRYSLLAASGQLSQVYPEGLPRLANTDVYFSFEQVMAGVQDLISGLPEPFFTYIHLIPPHAPYQPSREFLGMFDDGWQPEEKKRHPLAPRLTQERMNEQRQVYDEYIADADAELGKLIDTLESSGLLERSVVILTSDHGEAFERGVVGHSTPLVLEPGINIPLVISMPGIRERKDFHTLTSTVDLLPTLVSLSGQAVPGWSEGRILPGIGPAASQDRGVFVVEAKRNPAYSPLTKATTCMLEGDYKLVHYRGYRYGRDDYEFYDLKNDPEELNDIYTTHPTARRMQLELNRTLFMADLPYLKE